MKLALVFVALSLLQGWLLQWILVSGIVLYTKAASSFFGKTGLSYGPQEPPADLFHQVHESLPTWCRWSCWVLAFALSALLMTFANF